MTAEASAEAAETTGNYFDLKVGGWVIASGASWMILGSGLVQVVRALILTRLRARTP
jgi:hypothetical protein